jgi:hypothetical protein
LHQVLTHLPAQHAALLLISHSTFFLSWFISGADTLPPIISHAVTFVKHVDLILRHELFICLTSLLNNRLPGVTDVVLPPLRLASFAFDFF